MALSDTFTDTNGTNLSSHTSDSGHTWSRHTSYATGTLTIGASGDVYQSGASGGCAYICSWTPATAEYDVQADFRYPASSGSSAVNGICGRMASGANTMYLFRFNETGTTWELYKGVAGTFTLLATSTTNKPSTGGAAVTGVLQMRNSGTLLTCLAGGTSVITSSDNAITSAGQVGMRATNFVADSNGVHIDNMTGTDVGAVAATSRPLFAHRTRQVVRRRFF